MHASDNIALDIILDHLPSQIYWKDVEGMILGCNKAFLEASGFLVKSEIVGKTDHDMPWRLRANFIQNQDNEVLKSQENLSLEHDKHFLQISLLVDNGGKIIGTINTSTDLKGYHTALKKKYNRMEEVIAKMPGHVWWQDAKGFIQGSNDQQAQTFGFKSGEDLVGLRTFELLENVSDQVEQGPTANYLDLIDNYIIKHGQEETVEEEVAFGQKVSIHLSKKVPTYDPHGNSTGLVGIAFDITEYKEREEAWMRANGMIVDVA